LMSGDSIVDTIRWYQIVFNSIEEQPTALLINCGLRLSQPKAL